MVGHVPLVAAEQTGVVMAQANLSYNKQDFTPGRLVEQLPIPTSPARNVSGVKKSLLLNNNNRGKRNKTQGHRGESWNMEAQTLCCWLCATPAFAKAAVYGWDISLLLRKNTLPPAWVCCPVCLQRWSHRFFPHEPSLTSLSRSVSLAPVPHHSVQNLQQLHLEYFPAWSWE